MFHPAFQQSLYEDEARMSVEPENFFKLWISVPREYKFAKRVGEDNILQDPTSWLVFWQEGIQRGTEEPLLLSFKMTVKEL